MGYELMSVRGRGSQSETLCHLLGDHQRAWDYILVLGGRVVNVRHIVSLPERPRKSTVL